VPSPAARGSPEVAALTAQPLAVGLVHLPCRLGRPRQRYLTHKVEAVIGYRTVIGCLVAVGTLTACGPSAPPARVQRTVSCRGGTQIIGQRVQVGLRYAGQIVTGDLR